jgi:DNA recombination protein RmuC
MNRESMATILSPIHEELKGFKTKVEHIHQQETEQRVKLRTELENLQKLNMQITDQAEKLTKALKGEKKVQGNWGELMLENVLESSGLRLGTDYKREVSFGTEEGTFRPDAIIYLPQNKHLVIDAKTSLNAYTRFVNAEDEVERKAAIKEHASAVKARITELANKEYTRIPNINSPEVVIMFIPIESAYVEAMREDETIFQKAIEQKVLVATPTTLLTSLNIVRQLWRFEEQNKHTAALAERAERFYKKLNSFLESMQAVGNQLDKAKTTYSKAFSQLYTGPGNLILQASQFKELGVAVQKELPEELVSVAKLELFTAVETELQEAVL